MALNSFISVINPSVNDQCVFRGLRGTVFHCFLECLRLEPLFILLGLFLKFGEKFTHNAFICGSGSKTKGHMAAE